MKDELLKRGRKERPAIEAKKQTHKQTDKRTKLFFNILVENLNICYLLFICFTCFLFCFSKAPAYFDILYCNESSQIWVVCVKLFSECVTSSVLTVARHQICCFKLTSVLKEVKSKKSWKNSTNSSLDYFVSKYSSFPELSKYQLLMFMLLLKLSAFCNPTYQ